MFLIIDNYDSFVYNLAHACQILGVTVQVSRNDKLTCADITTLAPQAIILSPGPATPDQAGICLQVVKQFSGHIPILGVCLGHQTMAQAWNASIVREPPMHGEASTIFHNGRSALFDQIPSPFLAARYHSLTINSQDKANPYFSVTAWTQAGQVMAIEHIQHPSYGVQFHPESILTPCGQQMMRNFITIQRRFWRDKQFKS